MRLLDRYLFQQWLQAFALATLATVAVLLLENVQNELQDFLRWGTPLPQILLFYGSYITMQLPLVLPISLFLALLFALGSLHRNHELTAMRAAGHGILGLTRSLWLAAALLAGLLFYLNAEAVPKATETVRSLRELWRREAVAQNQAPAQAGLVSPLGYAHPASRRLWLMNRFSQYTNEGFGVSVYERDPLGREIRRVLAREAFYDEVARHWVLTEGRELHFDPVTGQPFRQVLFNQQAFAQWQESPAEMLALHAEPERLSLDEIGRLLSTHAAAEASRLRPYELRYWQILVQPLNCLVVTALAIPFAVAGVRTNPLVNTGRAAGLFACYFAGSKVVGMLGEQGHLPLSTAAWLPPAALLVLSLWLYRRMF